MTQKETITLLSGGVDLVTPAISMAPGSLIASRNYESEARGYRRCQGYERFDGQPAPSEEPYWILAFTGATAAIAAGLTVTGATSGATAITVVQSTYDGAGGGSMTLVRAAGTFVDGEELRVAGARVGDSDGELQLSGTTDDRSRAESIALAADYARALINPVPGAGPVRGVHHFKGDVYAFRDNVGETACIMHKATTTGWAAVAIGLRIDFNLGTAEILEGQLVTGGTSGATGTASRVVVRSGSWTSGTAVGYIVFASVTGTFSTGEFITSPSGSATSTSAAANIAIPPGGKILAINHNFYGLVDRFAMYAASTAGFAFEYDGTTLTPINTGIQPADDKPKRVGVHANHLVLGYNAGAILISGTGLPLSYLAIDGAAEISLGEDITDILSNSATSTVVFGINRIGYLAGTSVDDFAFQIITSSSGAKPDTAVMLNEPIYMDDQGVRKMSTSQAFGDWKLGSMTQKIEPFFSTQRLVSATAVGAQIVRSKDQYRLYFSNSLVMQLYLGRKNPEPMFYEYLFVPTCLASGETIEGYEVLFAGGADGYVYQIDKGTSFDGANILAYMRTPFASQGTPHQDSRYHSVRFDVVSDAEVDVAFGVGAEYSYGNDDLPSPIEQTQQLSGTGGYWSVDNWDQFVWSGLAQTELYVDLQAIGKNISLFVVTDTAQNEPHTISSYTLNYTPRRRLR